MTTTTLKGLGAIEATATKGRTDSASPAAGGRVALYVTDMTQFQGHVRATTTGGQSGYDGTVYVQLPGVLGRSVMDLVVPPNINIEEYVVEGGRWGVTGLLTITHTRCTTTRFAQLLSGAHTRLC